MFKNLSVFQISFLTSLAYCIMGNLVGILIYNEIISDHSLVSYIFFPYSLPWSMCLLVGFDYSVFIFQLPIILVLTFVFFPVGIWLSKRN